MAYDEDGPSAGTTETADLDPVGVIYSLVDPGWVARLVAAEYDVGESDVRFELDLLTHLHGHGVPVSYPLPRRNGDLLGTVAAPEGDRFYSLFSWAPGEPPESLTVDQAHLLGRTVAGIHVAADLYEPSHTRYRLDEATKLDRPLAELAQQIRDASPDDAATIARYTAEIRAQLAAFDPGPTGWGIIHGDVRAATLSGPRRLPGCPSLQRRRTRDDHHVRATRLDRT